MYIPSIIITILFIAFAVLCIVSICVTIFTSRKCLGAALMSFVAAMIMWTIGHL